MQSTDANANVQLFVQSTDANANVQMFVQSTDANANVEFVSFRQKMKFFEKEIQEQSESTVVRHPGV